VTKPHMYSHLYAIPVVSKAVFVYALSIFLLLGFRLRRVLFSFRFVDLRIRIGFGVD
jgi:hypothetical protein